MQLTNLEKALLRAANAFIQSYNERKEVEQGVGSHPPQQSAQSAPTPTSNGIPVCNIHGKPNRPSKKGNGYYCLDCFLERKNARN
jgi:hypothetical protein